MGILTDQTGGGRQRRQGCVGGGSWRRSEYDLLRDALLSLRICICMWRFGSGEKAEIVCLRRM